MKSIPTFIHLSRRTIIVALGALILLLAGNPIAAWSQAGGEVLGPPTPEKVVPAIPALPAFATLGHWEMRTEPVEPLRVDLLRPGEHAVRRLCRYYERPFDRTSPIASSISPLEWPDVFGDVGLNPRRQQAEFEKLMASNALAFRTLIVLDRGALPDTVMRAISDAAPVVLNAPGTPIVYGYDSREPDQWWWMQQEGSTEIVFESERMSRYVYWADDPTSNIAWAVTGIDSVKLRYRKTVADGYEWIKAVDLSVRGESGLGLLPYPLTLRAFRDSARVSAGLPQITEPIHPNDPLGIRRARQAREYGTALLEHMTVMATDTLESQPLRLALYFYHNAIQTLTRLDTLLYDAVPGIITPDQYEANWANEVRRSQVAARMNDLLEWEKQAAEQLATVLSLGSKSP